MMRFDNIVTLPSGNLARGFNVRDLGNGRVQVAYVYTDRRRAHQVSRHFTAEFLNGRLQSITARSARGGRVEAFSTSIIIDELLEMLSEFLEASQDVAQHRYAPAKVEAPAVQCPAQTREGITCKGCRLCAKDREAIVVFGIHGAHKGKARKAIQIHQAKLAR